ncbi:hypothetical protein ACFW16_04815 [Inquilinus sp. NPDC058860]|uniref:hypothetical protein n=1 Tax=Inquilinus sp. NPDC058860 TaxID=3346652 RepID=UPI0036C9E73C
MHDATQIRPAAAGPAIDPDRIEPGWSPPVDRLALSWDEVAASWLAVCGLLAILGVAAIIGREPVGEPVYLTAGPPGIGLHGAGLHGVGPAAGAEDCRTPTVQGTAPFILAPRPQGHA